MIDNISTRLHLHLETIKSYGVKQLGYFGSYARGDENENSDIDILVEFAEGMETFRNFMHLCSFLEEKLGLPVDLVTRESLNPRLLKNIEKEIIYERL